MTNTFLRPIRAVTILLAVSGVAHALPPAFTVNDTRDLPDLSLADGVCRVNAPPLPAKCTLRAAVQQANASVGSATITVPNGTYNLTNLDADGDRDLDVTKSMTIVASAQASVLVQVGTNGDRPNRVFDVQSGTLTLQGIVAANSRPGPGYEGGCMRVANGAGLTLENSQVVNCVTTNSDGGGIHNSGALTLAAGASLSSNRTYATGATAAGRGGAVFNASSGVVSSTGSVFVSANHAQKGGGLYNAGVLSGNGLTIVSNTATQGGGIFATGTTYLGSASVHHNSATDGGGVYQFGSGLTLNASSLFSNAATSQGGAIYLSGEPTDSAFVTDTSFSSDHATYSGGGVFSEGPTLMLNATTFTGELSDHEGGAVATNGDVECLAACTFDDNRCYAPTVAVTAGLCGAAVYSAQTVHMFDSTFSSNRSGVSAHADGGAIASERVKLTRCTFDGNTTLGAGGALYVSGGGYIENSTFWQNESTGADGGAIAADSTGLPLAIHSSTFVENWSSGYGTTIQAMAGAVALANTVIIDIGADNSIFCDTGSIASLGYNFLTGIELGCTVSGSASLDVFGDNGTALLGSLASNGGLTKTVAMAGASALIDAGDPAGCLSADGSGATLSMDQRDLLGTSRTTDGNADGTDRCDIGAYEFGAASGYVAFTTASSSIGEAGGAITLHVKRYARSPVLLGAVTVSCAPTAGTATASDYSATTTTLSWAAGDDTEQTFAIAIFNDALHESSETFTVVCTVVSGAREVGAPHTVTIVDND